MKYGSFHIYSFKPKLLTNGRLQEQRRRFKVGINGTYSSRKDFDANIFFNELPKAIKPI